MIATQRHQKLSLLTPWRHLKLNQGLQLSDKPRCLQSLPSGTAARTRVDEVPFSEKSALQRFGYAQVAASNLLRLEKPGSITQILGWLVIPFASTFRSGGSPMTSILPTLRAIASRLYSRDDRRNRSIKRRRSAFLHVEGLEDRRMLATFYVDDAFAVTNDTGPTGLSTGDTVTWQAGADSAHAPSTVTGLTFGTNAFTSIQAAVNAAASTPEANDLIAVGAGTFNESVTVNTSVTLLGNRAGVDAQTRTAANESIVSGPSGATAFYVTANNVTIDGFTVQNATSSNQFGFGILLGAGTSGHTVRNNIIQDNIVGIGLGSDNTTISNNLITDNNASGPAGGTGIYSDEFVAGGTLTNVTITDNTISDNNNAAIVISPSSSAQAASNIMISSNLLDANGNGVVLINTVNSSITANEITDSADAGINLAGGTSGITITNNVVTSGDTQGILINNTPFFTTGANSNVTINNNNISGNAGPEIEVVAGSYTGTLNAASNFFGSAGGPAAGEIRGANITVTPFLTSGVDANPNLRGFQVAVPAADLAVTKTASSSSVEANGLLTYTITVTNIGTAAAQNVTLSDALSSSVSLVNLQQLPFGWVTSTAGDPTVFTATNATLAAGASATFVYVVRADNDLQAGSNLTNTVTVSATADANLVNNTATSTVPVVDAEVELVCEVTTDNQPGSAGTAVIADDADTDGSVLIVTGTSANDTITIDRQSGNRIRVRIGNVTKTFDQDVNAEAFDRIVVFGQNGNDKISVSNSTGVAAVLFGGSGNDTLTGGSAADELDGGAGNDTLNGGAGNDVLCGGQGNDNVNGGAGNDRVGGDAGNDRLRGDGGDDVLLGNAGNDDLDGGAGNDRLFGQEGNDSLFGGIGNDMLIGGVGNDRMDGGAGLDVLIGGRGNDKLNGGAGSDILVGGQASVDEDVAALDDILAAWVSGAPTRRDTIRTLFGDIADDGHDKLEGAGGADWLLTTGRDSGRDHGHGKKDD